MKRKATLPKVIYNLIAQNTFHLNKGILKLETLNLGDLNL